VCRAFWTIEEYEMSRFNMKDGVNWWDKAAHEDACGAITNHNANNYAEIRQSGERESGPFIREFQPYLSISVHDATIIDYGCGVGRLTFWFDKYFTRSVGIDASPKMIELARENNPLEFGEYLLCDGSSLPLPDNSADVLFSTIVFHHMPIDAVVSVVQDARRVLRPGGIVAFQLGIYTKPEDAHESPSPQMAFIHNEGALKQILDGYEPVRLSVNAYWGLHIARVIK
jgi:SAM-dependent methyltransferase